MSSPSGSRASMSSKFFRRMSPEDRKFWGTRNIIIPGSTTIFVIAAEETIKDGATLFFVIWAISVASVLTSYAILRFKPLGSGKGRNEMFTKLIFVTVNSVVYALALVAMLTFFIYGKDIPLFDYDISTQIFSIYMQKVWIMFLVFGISWLITNMVAKLVLK